MASASTYGPFGVRTSVNIVASSLSLRCPSMSVPPCERSAGLRCPTIHRGRRIRGVANYTDVPANSPRRCRCKLNGNGMDWPAVKVSPELTPLTVKPAPEIFTADIVTLEFPVFVKAALKSPLLPTFTLPKLRFDVLNVSTCVPATPVPLNPIVSGELGALLVSEIEPVTLLRR
jgi:hypothetical protein